jgi:transcriptional regulator with XRE-family HTH domain
LKNQSTQSTLRKILAQNIRLARTSRGWSQETLAELSNLHRTYIGAVERGEISTGLDTLERIAGAFDVPASTLIDPAIPTGLFYNNEWKPRP